MTDIENRMTKEEAQKSLQALRGFQQEAQQTIKTAWWHSLLASLFYGMIVYSYSAMRHENNWALGLIVGAVGFILVHAVAYYCYRLIGVRLRIMPRDSRSNYFLLATGVLFAVMIHLARVASLNDMQWVAIGISIMCLVLMFYLMNKFPTGELPPRDDLQ